uniref:CRISPR-associated protein Cas14a.1 n=1 Tax=Uncultured archaeon TaxID=115547 RepID=UPI0018E1DA1E|nr:Chain A, CRISPR-associated protein Cas14a.1 [uncultured archaeon]7C7L_B Chain B, CRISPR-associated protein Cas14a.1 [uncultured archaeon]
MGHHHHHHGSMAKNTITKTLKLRIVRPYNSAEVEKIVADEKNNREKIALEKNKDKVKEACSKHLKVAAYCTTQVERNACLFCKARKLDDKFYQKLRGQFPDAVFWQEISEIFRQLQKQAAEIYNQSLIELYYEIFIKGKGIANASSVEHYLSDVCYTRAAELFKNAAIASGLRSKIKSNFRLKELKNMKSGLPTTKSDNFPIPLVKQKGGQYTGFEISNHNSDFIIKIPFGRWQVKKEIDKYRPWEKFDFEQVQKSPKPISLLLSTQRRKRNKGWSKDEGTEAEIKKVMNGDYQTSYIEVKRGSKIGEKSAWMLNLSIDVPKIDKGVDPSIIGGIAVGVKSPLVCAINNAFSRYSISDNDLFHFNKKMFARRRILLKKNRHKRAGHGAKNKLKPITILTEKSERFRKKLIERWACEIADFFIKNKVGTVQMENLESMKRKEDSYFNIRLRGFWPYAEMQNKIEFKLKQYGIEIRKVAPNNTSKTCSKCGHLNNYFNFEYRKKNKFPHFKCEKCNFKENADYNAALNISNPKLKSTKEEP